MGANWSKIELGYLVSTKNGIEIGSAYMSNPGYPTSGSILIPYRPVSKLTPTLKIKPFISSLNIITRQGGLLSINYINTTVLSTSIYFYYSASTCDVNDLQLSVVIFEPNMPGMIFVDGTIEQNSAVTKTSTQIDRNFLEELRIYFIGLISLTSKDSLGLSI
jgi:hypothetical protein